MHRRLQCGKQLRKRSHTMFLKTAVAALALAGAAVAVPVVAEAHSWGYGPLPWWQHPPRYDYAPPPAYYPPPAYAYPVPVPEAPNPGLVLMRQALKSLPGIIAAAKAPPAYASVAPVAPPVALAPDPTVRWVQQALNVLMHAGLNVDGIAGPATTDAIVNYQSVNSLPTDGIAGSATIAMISRQLNAASAVPPAPPPA
jgi:hypothetical protein